MSGYAASGRPCPSSLPRTPAAHGGRVAGQVGTCEPGKTLHRRASVFVIGLLATLIGDAVARADGGVSLGPRGGLQLRGDTDPFVGADLRLTFSLSPLTINPTFDYHFDEDRTLFQFGVNALYVLPVSAPLKPYAGVGIGLTAFAYDDSGVMMTGANQRDGQGSRVGLNLIGGVTFATPWLTPFLQTMVSLGEIDLVTIGGGVLFDVVGGR
jgi:opacity protein-like surface antigen